MPRPRKQTIGQILLADDYGNIIDELSAAGCDKNLIVIGVSESGRLKVGDNIKNDFQLLGILEMAVVKAEERIRCSEGEI